MFIAVMRDPKGFTMIETLVVMSLVLIGMLGGYALLANTQVTREQNIQAVQAQQEARNIVEQIVRDLRESSLDHVWIDSANSKSDSIVFFTPRDEDGAFNVYHRVDSDGDPLKGYGRPVWRRTIAYSLDSESNCLYRYQLPALIRPPRVASAPA